MFGAVAIVVLVLAAALLAHAATRPDNFRVQRSTRVQAPPQKIFDLINDFHRWNSWSPYEKLDPAMKRTFAGTDRGQGTIYTWAGNSKAGEGRMEITDTIPVSKITIKLDFLKPFEGHNTAEFTIEPDGSTSKVTWAMYGPQKFMFKVMSVFVSMDNLVGKDFEAGLANLKTVAEN